MRRAHLTAPDRANGQPVIRSAARMLYVIHQLVRTPGGQQLAEISRGLGLPEVTVLRLLRTLVHEGLVRKDPERGRYRMSPRFWLVSLSEFPEVGDSQRHLQRTLQELARYSAATAMLLVPYVGLRVVGAACASPPAGADAPRSPLGLNAPMHAVAGGKCYLASLADDELRAWVRGPLPAPTNRTLADPEALLRDLQQVRVRGYALERGECHPSLSGVAVPLVDVSGTLSAAVHLCCPTRMLTSERLRLWVPRLQSAARSFSKVCSALAQMGGP